MRLERGPIKPVPMVFAGVSFAALVVYLFVEDQPDTAAIIVLGVVFGLLALRASELKRSEFQIDPQQGVLSYKSEFEGPEDPEDEN